ncbi:MAG: hypothetical protein MJY58_06750 [Bacteroidaceae bacterium]|nr:hypothetical protein [Bacteroidaceae bacterium]
MKRRTVFLIAVVFAMTACTEYDGSGNGLSLMPDYSDITIPCNIAPLNFRLDGASRFDVQIKGQAGNYNFKGRNGLVSFGVRKWHSMLEAEKGNVLEVGVTARTSKGEVYENSFTWTVSPDSIDPYLSYRLIEPAYEVWSEMAIEERCMENFSTRLIGENSQADKCCMNCHTSNGNGTSFLHLRGANGGTVLNRNGAVTKISTRTDRTGQGVYGDISRDGRYGVFTTADITFAIHSRYDMRMEVYDQRSDLVVVDFDNMTATDSPAVTGDDFQETFPCFSADGRVIFFCRARHHEQPDSIASMHYDIAAVQFDPATGRIGDKVITMVSAGNGLSFSHLKASPDGRWLMATAASYGTFPVWHKESELWLIDLQNHSVDIMADANTDGADTYHSWSSNSRWVVFASKRDDMIYGRPYITHIDENDRCTRAFVLPQRDPVLYTNTMKSYNIPELYTVPEDYGAGKVARLYKDASPVQVEYKF